MAGCTAALQAGGNNAAALLSKLLTTHALPLHQVSVTDPTQGSCTRSTLSHTHTHTQVTGSHEGCSSGLCSCGRQDSRSRAARAGQPKAHPTGAVSRACAATGDAGGAEEAVPQPHTCRGPAGPAKPSVHATRRWGGQLDKGWLQWSGSCCSTQLSSVLTWLISLHCWAVWCLDPCCLWVPAISSLLHNRGHNKTSLPYPANYLWCCLCRQCHGSRESSANSRSSSRGCR